MKKWIFVYVLLVLAVPGLAFGNGNAGGTAGAAGAGISGNAPADSGMDGATQPSPLLPGARPSGPVLPSDPGAGSGLGASPTGAGSGAGLGTEGWKGAGRPPTGAPPPGDMGMAPGGVSGQQSATTPGVTIYSPGGVRIITLPPGQQMGPGTGMQQQPGMGPGTSGESGSITR